MSRHGDNSPGSHVPNRRGSFLYKSNSDFKLSPKTVARDPSVASDLNLEEVIITPFAQILNTLHSLHGNLLKLSNHCNHVNLESIGKKFQENAKHFSSSKNEDFVNLATDTLKQLDWCLEQLEKIQTDKAVTEMARNKFKKLLSNEMSKCAESSKSGVQISEFICKTFLDQDPEMKGFKHTSPQVVSLTFNEQHQQSTNYKSGSKKTFGKHCFALIEEEDGNLNEASLSYKNVEVIKTNTELSQLLNTIDTWGMDIFKMASLTNNNALSTITMHILKKRNLFVKLRIPENNFQSFLLVIENRYRADVPYHNSVHAADVTQSSHYLLSIPTFKSAFTDLEIFATIFASAIHDTDHPGVTNQFLINTGSELALLYNDESILENHHVSIAFKLLQDSKFNFLNCFSNKARQLFRKMVISIVLATDMNKHMNHLAHLKTMAETRSISGEHDLRLNNYAERNQVLQSLVHCSDLSNPTKNLSIYRKWNELISQEFFQQGDLEKKLGLEVSPMCDRSNATIEKNQVGFIDYIVHPLWEAWADLVHPHCQNILEALEDNREWYNNILCSSSSSVLS